MGGSTGAMTTWTPAGSPYIVRGDLTVPPGGTLVIEAGTEVRFARGDLQASGVVSCCTELTIRGDLVVDGTPSRPVELRGHDGARDNEWYGIVVAPEATRAELHDVVIQHADYPVAFESASGVQSLRRARVDHFDDVGVEVRAGHADLDQLHVFDGTGGVYVFATASISLTSSLVHGMSSRCVNVEMEAGTRPSWVEAVTLDDCGSYAIHTWRRSGSDTVLEVQNAILTNSIYGASASASDQRSMRVVNAAFHGNGTDTRWLTDSRNLMMFDPQFVGGGDYHLQPSSLAIDAGEGAMANDHDLDGRLRPFDGDGLGGAQPDLGAYEHGATFVCGDGVVQSGEACDDGNDVDSDACPSTCAEAVCGDGFVWAGVETCDDGGTTSGDGCSASCELESDAGRPDAGTGDAGTASGDAGREDGGSSPRDAGRASDAALALDAGASSRDAGGCGCRVSTPAPIGLGAWIAALALLGCVRRRP